MDYYKWHKRLLEEGKSWDEIAKMTRKKKLERIKRKIKNRW